MWPPTGIAIAAFLVFGYRMWPAVAIGAFLVNLTTAGSALSSLGIAAGNTIEGLVATWLVDRFANGYHAFERPQDVLKFAFLAALASPTLSATIGVTSLALTGFAGWADFAPIWLTWWLGDAAGALIVAPVLVLWTVDVDRPWSEAHRIELATLLLALIASGLVVFGGVDPFSTQHYPVEFLTFPVLVWAAFRFGPREAATGIFVLSGIAVAGTIRGFGPFVRDSQNESLLLLEAFMGVASVMSVALGAAVLDRRRAEETIRATEGRLRLAEERKVAEREEFLSVAAHELKTPMTSLQVAVQFLLRQLERSGTLDPRQVTRALNAVDEQTQKLARLVTELLETVRLQASRLQLDLETEDVQALVARTVERAQARTRRHELVLVSPEAVMARVDALRLEEVMDNLLDNAIKFSPGGGRIDIELHPRADEAIRLTVRDRGIGIPAEGRAHVFERFYQAHPEQRSGLGLGLYVSRQIVELHGGRIDAEFPEDGGTRFVVDLPAGVPVPA